MLWGDSVVSSLRQSNSVIAQQKSSMRTNIKARRSAMKEVEHRNASRDVIANVIGNVPLEPDDCVAAFWPVSNEPDIRLLLEVIVENGHKCALPVVEEKEKPLSFRQYIPGMKLQPGPEGGVLQPAAESKILHPNIVLVPLLAFDASCYRLGYGGGYYDRTLAGMRRQSNLLTVGIAFEWQRVAMVPRNKYDQMLDCVVTDKKVWLVG